MPHHAKAAMWTVNGRWRWFSHCDQCHRWWLLGRYYEVYPPIENKGDASGWWYDCADCLVDTISEQLHELAAELEKIKAEGVMS